ncbi:MAG TPA: hypothetical protein VN030_01630 [Cellvibrio sp.]|nr:hypothetical protein [Cellvibrio sp.]
MRKKISILTSILGFSLATAAFAGDLGINVIVAGEIAPGVYGQVEIGSEPRPRLVYERPIIITASKRYAQAQPVYLHVPPGHAKHWSKHCHEYHACEHQVYFVKSSEYEPDYRSESDNHQDNHKHDQKGHKEGHGKGHGKNKQ